MDLQYQLIFESTPYGMAILETYSDSSDQISDFKLLEINPVFRQMFNLVNIDFKDKSITNVFGKDHQILSYLKQVNKDTSEFEFIEGITRFTGRVKWLTSNSLILFFDCKTLFDSDFEWHKDQLPFREFLYENAREGLVILDSNHRVVDVNAQFCQMLGYTPIELKKLFTWDFEVNMKEEDIRKGFDPKQNIDITFESIHKRKDGSTYPVEVSAKNYNWKGQMLVYCSCHDITNRRKAEQERDLSQALLNKLADQMPGVVYQYQLWPDGHSCFPYSSSGMFEIYEVTPDEVKLDATPVFGRLHPDDYDRIYNTIMESAATLEIYKQEFRVVLPKQGLRWRYCNAKPEKMPDGSVLWHGIISDITHLKEAEIALKHSYELLDYVISNNKGGVAVHDTEMNYIYVSQPYLKDYHLTGKEVIGKNHYDLIPDLPQKWREVHQRVLKGEIINATNDLFVNSDGEKIWAEWECRPWYKADDSIGGLIVYTENITLRINHQLAIKDNIERFNQIAEVSQTVIWEVDLNGLYTFVSTMAKSVWDYTPEQLVGNMHFYDLHPESERGAIKEIALEIINKGEIFKDFLNPILRQDGEIRWVLTNGLPIFNNNNELIGYRGSDVDITDKLAAEQKLKESENFANAIANSTPALLYIYDVNLRENIWTNASYKNFLAELNVNKTSLNVNEIIKLVHPRDMIGVFSKTSDMIANPEIVKIEHELRLKTNNGWQWMNLLLSVFKRNEQGYPTQLMGAMFDINDKKIAESELVDAKNRAEESDRLKTAFLQNMSHEIRTPMNGIIGFVNLLAEPDLPQNEKMEYIEMVNKSGQRLLHTINDIIEISKIEAGFVDITFSDVDIHKVLDYHFNFFKVIAHDKGLIINNNTKDCQHEHLVKTDRNRLDGILTNLLYNAIKFTNKGSIEFGHYVEKNEIIFYVKDTGIGIESSKIDAIFERFIQADINTTRPYEGNGLGLTITKAYIAALGGRIWVESELNIGSTFYFSLPYSSSIKREVVEKTTSDADQLSFSTPQKLLIVEDEYFNYVLLTKILRRENFEFIHLDDGAKAVDFIANNEDVALVLMDVKMPIMNGLDATREIRKFNSTIPIIAQTAHALSGEREKAIEAGCTDYVSKPINRQVLIEKIHKCLNK